MKRKTEFLVGAVVVAAGIAAAAGVYRTGDSKAAEVPMVGIMPDVTAAVQITEQQDAGQQVQDVGQEVHNAGQQVQDVGQEVQDAGQQVQDVGQEVQDAGQQVGQQVSETQQAAENGAAGQQDAGGSEEITEDSVYWPIVEQYREAAANNMYADLFESGDWSAKGEFVNIELLNNARFFEEDMHFDVYYTICDINQDGVSEFFIGGGVNADSVVLYDMFTTDGEKVIPVFEVSTLGYRSNLNVYEDNSFAVYGSGGAATNNISYYTLPANGTQPQLVEEYGMLDGVCYHKGEDGSSAELSQEEYFAKSDEFTQNLKQFQWNPVNGAE